MFKSLQFKKVGGPAQCANRTESKSHQLMFKIKVIEIIINMAPHKISQNTNNCLKYNSLQEIQ